MIDNATRKLFFIKFDPGIFFYLYIIFKFDENMKKSLKYYVSINEMNFTFKPFLIIQAPLFLETKVTYWHKNSKSVTGIIGLLVS